MAEATDIKKLSDFDVLTILQSRECFVCGSRKIAMRSHCSRCYYKLAPESRNALYQRFGAGYAEGYVASLNELGVEAAYVEQ